MRLCFLVLPCDGVPGMGGILTLPQEVLDSFDARATYIAMGEALAPLVMLYSCPDRFRQRRVLLNVDNMGVVCGLVSGSSSTVDFGAILTAVHLALASRGCALWTEHVDSGANVADGGTREGARCPMAKALGIALPTVAVPPWPKCVRAASANEWLEWLSS